MLPNSGQSGQSEAPTRKLSYQRSVSFRDRKLSYQRSVSFRNYGRPRIKNQKEIGPSTLRGIDTNATEDKALLDDLVDAIKTGDKSYTLELIRNNTMPRLIKLRFRIDIRVGKSEQRYLETGVYVPIERQYAPMEVTLLQLGVVLEREEIVELMLRMANQDREDRGSTLYGLIGKSETIVHFEGDATKYRHLDQMLHGTTAFHLAARYHANSLKLFLDHAKDDETVLQDLINGGRSSLNSSALHYAACNPDTESTRHVHNTTMRNLKVISNVLDCFWIT